MIWRPYTNIVDHDDYEGEVWVAYEFNDQQKVTMGTREDGKVRAAWVPHYAIRAWSPILYPPYPEEYK